MAARERNKEEHEGGGGRGGGTEYACMEERQAKEKEALSG
jgi:hypothetical protein